MSTDIFTAVIHCVVATPQTPTSPSCFNNLGTSGFIKFLKHFIPSPEPSETETGVFYFASATNQEECQTACGAETSCHAYTWIPATHAFSAYRRQCYGVNEGLATEYCATCKCTLQRIRRRCHGDNVYRICGKCFCNDFDSCKCRCNNLSSTTVHCSECISIQRDEQLVSHEHIKI